MEQTFNDLCNERKQQAEYRWSGFVLWIFVETALGIIREHVLLITEGATMKSILANPRSASLISSILLAVAFIVAPLIYLFGNLRDTMGPFSYAVADFLYGPVWAASLVTLVFALRERIDARPAPHVTGAAGRSPRSRSHDCRCLYTVCQPPLPSDSS